MRKQVRLTVAVPLLAATLLACRPAEAQFSGIGDIGPSKGEVAAVILGMVAVAAVITIGVVYAVKHKPSITGCAVAGSAGLTLQNEGDSQKFLSPGTRRESNPATESKCRGRSRRAAMRPLADSRSYG